MESKPRPRLLGTSIQCLWGLAFLLLFATEGWAQFAAPIPMNWRREAALRDVTFVDDQTGWACGDHGTILRTLDGGATWYTVESGVQCTLESISFVDAFRGWVAGGYEMPSSGRRVAVLLATQDGGASWHRLPAANLPWLHRIEFVDGADGFAIGDSSALHMSGIFITRDGGRSWSTLTGVAPMGWLDGDSADRATFSVVGDRTGVHRFVGDSFEPSPATDGLSPQFNRIRFSENGTGWAVGERGTVYRSPDQGKTWRTALDRSLLPGIDQVQWHALATRGNSIWMAGSPGGLVLHSHDHGQSWEVSHTSMACDILGMWFVDEMTGWAVGTLGRIAHTRDGGRTWLVQRNDSVGTFVVLIASDPRSIPPELIAHLGAQEGWLVEVLCPQAGAGPENSNGTFRSGFEQWNAMLGASSTHWWSIPHAGLFPPPLTDFDRDALRQSLSVETQQEDWRREVVLFLRSRKPQVVLLPAPNHSNPREGDKRLYDLAVAAVDQAGSRSSFPEHFQVLGLGAWRVSKTMAWSSREGRQGLQITSDQFAVGLGRTLADFAMPARYAIDPMSVSEPPRFQLQLIDTTLPVGAARESVGGGILSDQARVGHRSQDSNPRGTYQQVSRLSRVDDVHRSLIAVAADSQADPMGAAWIGVVDRQLSDLDLWSGGNWVMRLAVAHERSRQLKAAARAHRLMLDRFPDHPLSDASALWLWNYYSSLEQQWSASSESREPTIQLTAAEQEEGNPIMTVDEALRLLDQEMTDDLAVEESSAESSDATESSALADDGLNVDRPLVGINGLDPSQVPHTTIGGAEVGREAHLPIFIFGDQESAGASGSATRDLPYADLDPSLHQNYLMALDAWVRRDRPGLAYDWRYRTLGAYSPGTRGAAGWLSLAEFDSRFAGIAQAESWLEQPMTREAPLERLMPIWVGTPIKLDGILDEPIWSTAIDEGRFVAPKSEDRSNTAAMTLVVAVDDQFLYLGATCQRHPDLAYPPPPGPRLRDERPSDVDHLMVLIDPDRDHRTAFTFYIDHRGRAWDGIGDDPTWDPQWFVANSETDRTWTIEAAIPLEQLGVGESVDNEWWGFGVRRVCPGLSERSWGLQAAERVSGNHSQPLIGGLLNMGQLLPVAEQ